MILILFLVSLLIGRESGARIFSQSQTLAMQNQSNRKITVDAQVKITLSLVDNYLDD